MCGFVGGTLVTDRYPQAAERLRHRGPDAGGFWSNDKVNLAFRRLSVIDLDERSNQPMASQDGQVVLMFNGEIYGFKNVRSSLESHGFRFETESDTEVLLNAYLHWGERFVDHVDGMFAIVIYDQRSQRILLWRDRVGIKPLYYFWDQNHFVFASEIKAIQELFEGQLQPNPEAYYDFLTYHAIPAPKTGLKNVALLRPAHSIQLEVENKRLSAPSCYWELSYTPDEILTFDGAQEQLRELLGRSVSDQLVSDVPVGCFLSGGVDSSVLAHEGARATSKLNTFSMGFEGEASELPFAREVAEYLGTEHFEAELPATAIDFEKLADWFDDPFADTSAFPTHAVAKEARRHVTVALSGDGGDELFGGYARYQQVTDRSRVSVRLFDWWESTKQRFTHGRLPRKAMNYLALHLAPTLNLYLKRMAGLSRGEKRPYAREFGLSDEYDDLWAWREYWRPELPMRTRLQYLDFHRYLPDILLPKVDRTSMAVSLEVRVPFLAKEVVEFAFRIPEGIRFTTGPKGVLRAAYQNDLPTSILDRVKSGFGMPRSFRKVGAQYWPMLALKRSYGIHFPPGLTPASLDGKAEVT